MNDAQSAYQQYLQSDHWKAIRKRAAKRFAGCIITGRTDFELHHLNYRNLGAERFWYDLIPLAPELHSEFHACAEENGLEFYDILDWLKLTQRYVKPEIHAQLVESRRYNVDLKLGAVRANSGAVNIFEGQKPRELPKPQVQQVTKTRKCHRRRKSEGERVDRVTRKLEQEKSAKRRRKCGFSKTPSVRPRRKWSDNWTC